MSNVIAIFNRDGLYMCPYGSEDGSALREDPEFHFNYVVHEISFADNHFFAYHTGRLKMVQERIKAKRESGEYKPCRSVNEVLKAMRADQAKEVGALRASIIADLNAALDAICKRKPVDPEYRIGGQRHPTITKEFAAEELICLLEKYEEKPYAAMCDMSGNFIDWFSGTAARKLTEEAKPFQIHHWSARIIKGMGMKLPE